MLSERLRRLEAVAPVVVVSEAGLDLPKKGADALCHVAASVAATAHALAAVLHQGVARMWCLAETLLS